MKKFLKMIFAVIVVMIAGYNIYMSQNKFELSDLTLVNIEAFAQGEYDQPYYVAPCPNRPGSECRSKKYDDGNRCGTLSSCS